MTFNISHSFYSCYSCVVLFLIIRIYLVSVSVSARKVTVKGTRGTLTRDFSHVQGDIAMVGGYAYALHRSHKLLTLLI